MITMRFTPWYFRWLSILAANCLFLTGISQAQAPSALENSQDALALVDQEASVLEALRATVDRGQFELESVIKAHDWSAEELIEFVRNDIAFEQYPGVLRGARGTLMSRAGNSLDQALLLATLLKPAGEDARIVRGNLNPEQAARLLAEMKRLPELPPPADLRRWNEISQGSKDLEGTSGSVTQGKDIDIATELAGLLKTALENTENQSPIGPTQAEILEEASDYFWLEYRDGTTGAWTAVHPAFIENPWKPGELKPVEFYASEIPQELNHKIRIAVFVERWELGTLVVEQVVPDWQRPVANILGRSLYFFNAPDKFSDKVLTGAYSDLLQASELFVPVLAGSVVAGSRGFDIDGVPYDLTALAGGGMGAAALFRTTGERTDAAAAALYNLDGEGSEESRSRYLTAQWIEYSLIDPSGQERAFRRFMFDRIGPTVRQAGGSDNPGLDRAEPWQVLVSEEFMVAAGSYPDALTLDEYLSRQVGTNQLLQTYLESAQLSFQDFAEAEGSDAGPNSTTLLALLREFDNGIVDQLGAPTYRSGPTVLALHSSAASPDRMKFSTDIISNERRSKAWNDAPLAQKDLILHGVWETVAEGLALQMLGIQGTRVETPLEAFSTIGDNNDVQFVSSPTQFSAIDLTPDQRLQLQSELDSGFWVAVHTPDEGQPFSWWRFDPATGTIVGMLYNGRGATATEYVIGLIGVAMGAIGALGIYSLGKCTFEKLGAQSAGAKVRPLECCLIDEYGDLPGFPETLAFKWAMSTDYLTRKVGMDEELCMGKVGSGAQ